MVTENISYYYTVSRAEVSLYLDNIRATGDPISLNHYLANKLGYNVIASCHDNELQTLDLQRGNFTHVNFRKADLSDCNLQHSIWTLAHVEEAIFDRNELQGIHFFQTFAEKSIWQHVNFTGNFSQAKMNGSKIKDCTISTTLQHLGCHWELTELDQVEIQDPHLFQEAIQLTEGVIQELQQFKIKEETRWSNQKKIDQVILHNLKALDPKIEVLKRLAHYEKRDVLTQSFNQLAIRYVEPDIEYTVNDNQTIMPFYNAVDAFISSEQHTMAILSDSGYGKTTSALSTLIECKHRFQREKIWLPIYINMKRVSDIRKDNFLVAALEIIFTQSQIDVLMDNYQCIFFFDCYEQCNYAASHFVLEECLFLNDNWVKGPPKFVFLIDREFTLQKAFFEQDYRDALRFGPLNKLPLTAIGTIQPFTAHQVELYIQTYSNIDLTDFKQYEHLQDLDLSIPINLHITCEVLNDLSPQHLLPASELALFSAFLQKWYLNVKDKFTNSVSYDDFISYIEHYAYLMFKSGKDYLEIPRPKGIILSKHRALPIYHPDPKVCALENVLMQEMSYLIPLKLTLRDNGTLFHYEFCYQLLRHYALANKLFKTLIADDSLFEMRLEEWNQGSITNLPDVLYYLQLLVENYPFTEKLDQRLQELNVGGVNVLDVVNVTAASNAMTVINLIKEMSEPTERLHLYRGTKHKGSSPHSPVKLESLASPQTFGLFSQKDAVQPQKGNLEIETKETSESLLHPIDSD